MDLKQNTDEEAITKILGFLDDHADAMSDCEILAEARERLGDDKLVVENVDAVVAGLTSVARVSETPQAAKREQAIGRGRLSRVARIGWGYGLLAAACVVAAFFASFTHSFWHTSGAPLESVAQAPMPDIGNALSKSDKLSSAPGATPQRGPAVAKVPNEPIQSILKQYSAAGSGASAVATVPTRSVELAVRQAATASAVVPPPAHPTATLRRRLSDLEEPHAVMVASAAPLPPPPQPEQALDLKELDEAVLDSVWTTERILPIFLAAANKHDATAELLLGQLYHRGGRRIHANPREAVKWYKAAINHGSIEAMIMLARLYEEDTPFKNPTEAWRLYEQAARSGNSLAIRAFAARKRAGN